jgi:hypothetical protein
MNNTTVNHRTSAIGNTNEQEIANVIKFSNARHYNEKFTKNKSIRKDTMIGMLNNRILKSMTKFS